MEGSNSFSINQDPCLNVVCSGNRFCSEGVCQCLDGFVGPYCLNICSNNCSGNGVCIKSECVCNFGFAGEDCSVVELCDKSCSDRGFCFKGVNEEIADCSLFAAYFLLIISNLSRDVIAKKVSQERTEK